MKYSHLILSLLILLSTNLVAQTGGVKGIVTSAKNNKPLEGVKILFYTDTIIVDSVFTDENGNYFQANLPANQYSIEAIRKGFKTRKINNISIQAKQVGSFSFTLEKGESLIESDFISNEGVVDPNGVKQVAKKILYDIPESGSEYLHCVEITAYKTSLIDKDAGGNSVTIRAEDVVNLPYRSAASISTTVGGVQSGANGEIISVRGARSDANAYYIDGMRVGSLNGLPKSAIGSVNTIVGGLPANYGDVTGGVISISTREAYDHSYYNPTPEYYTGYDDYNNNHNTESYEMIYENQFLSPENDPLSTFSIDVDKASYSNVRRMLNNNRLPGPGAVRIEELINYFEYQYPSSASVEEPISIHTEYAVCPWNENHQLLKVGMKGYEIPTDDIQPSNLIFLIDVSGSMSSYNKLPLLKKAMKMLVGKLRAEDNISIVVYAGSSGMVLKPTPGNKNVVINASLNRLQYGGSTNGAGGIELAYKLAEENYIEDGNNRVILATDGDFNVGTTSNDELQRLIEEKRESGVYLTTLGFGMGNYKDDRMEMLADKGNGNYYYIDNLLEAKKVLVTELFGTLFTIAKDVKLQLEFNPNKVKSYRLVGYENRLLAAQDFNNDAKDAGELGSGHTVTALYEIIPASSSETVPNTSVDSLRYQKTILSDNSITNELVQVKCRYKLPKSDTSKLKVFYINDEVNEASLDFKFAASVASYGMLLRNSDYTNSVTYDKVFDLAKEGVGEDRHNYRLEFLHLVRTAEKLSNLSSK